ncbi:MAG: ATP-binding protein, partial [Aquabacterium sp.]
RFALPVEPAAAAVPGSGATPATGEAPFPTEDLVDTAPLFGREADLSRLNTLLVSHGLVTLVGPAGVGKTRLARRAAAIWHGRAVWTDLAGLAAGSTAAEVGQAALRALGSGATPADPLPALRRALAECPTLLVLDNAEHVVQGCAALVASLSDWGAGAAGQAVPAGQNAPAHGLRLLATSQLPLAMPHEVVQRVDPLALPEEGTEAAAAAWPDSAELDPARLGDGALALLVERIAAADQRARLKPAALPLLASLCRKLDGLPLALEMAAARVPLLGLQGVHDALNERFALLTRGHRNAARRHGTLEEALQWSYRLLDAEEQRLFRALGVFVGGFTLDLVVALMSPPEAPGHERWTVIDRLAVLVDRCLVVADSAEPPRYHLLESLRSLALQQLQAQDEAPSVQRRHAQALVALVDRHPIGTAAHAQACNPEMQNLSAAVAWATAHDLALAAGLSERWGRAATFGPWRAQSLHALQALEPAMRAAQGRSLPAPLQAAWWVEFARGLNLARSPRAAAVAREACDQHRVLGDQGRLLFAYVVWVRSTPEPGPELDEACAALRAQQARCPDLSAARRMNALSALVMADQIRGRFEAVLEGRRHEIAMAEANGFPMQAEAAHCNVIAALNALGRHAEAAAKGQALLERIDADGSGRNGNLPWMLAELIVAQVHAGCIPQASALAARAWACWRRFEVPDLLPSLALLALEQGRPEAAAQLFGYARACAAGLSNEAQLFGTPQVSRTLQRIGRRLGQQRLQALLAAGAVCTDAQAHALAIS